MKEKKYETAYQIIMQRLPLPYVGWPGMSGSLPEANAVELRSDEAVAIRHLKRFAADYAYEHGYEFNPQ